MLIINKGNNKMTKTNSNLESITSEYKLKVISVLNNIAH